MNNSIVRGVFLAFVRVHVLHHAAEGRIFGLEMIEELRRHGYTLSPGTLYPIFHSMEKAGYLRSVDEVVNGKLRKYYEATAKGRRLLKEVKGKIQELMEEVIRD
ncbi:MAG TPA: PadR family transcriptional regulator [Burkholderiales bacterium]|nr:PadR family transcriptional regulator [Burkholderiales bacterium]